MARAGAVERVNGAGPRNCSGSCDERSGTPLWLTGCSPPRPHRAGAPVGMPARSPESQRQGHTHGRITSAKLGSCGAFAWRRLFPHRQRVHPARQPRACMATGGVDGQRRRVRGAYWVRALQTAQLTSRNGVARRPGSRDRGTRSCSRRDDSFAVDHISDSARVASRPRHLAGRHCCSGVSRCSSGRGNVTSSSAKALTLSIRPPGSPTLAK